MAARMWPYTFKKPDVVEPKLQPTLKERVLAYEALSAENAKLTEALDWFGSQRNVQLYFYSPVYGDDDDQSTEWRVAREFGSVNDREWEDIGSGASPIEAILAALKETRHGRP